MYIFVKYLHNKSIKMHNSNIKHLYNKANNKKELTLIVAEHFNLNPLSVRNNWFGGFYQVPTKHQDKLIRIMQNYIKVESQLIPH